MYKVCALFFLYRYRRIYPVIILTKGPLSWNWDYIKHNSLKVFSLATLPWIIECLATAFFAHILLEYPWYWGKYGINFLKKVTHFKIKLESVILNIKKFRVFSFTPSYQIFQLSSTTKYLSQRLSMSLFISLSLKIDITSQK